MLTPCLLLALSGSARAAAPAHEALLVLVESEEDAARVRALGLGFAEGRDGDHTLFHGPPGSLAAARAAGLDARFAPAPRSLAEEDLAAYHDPDEVVAVADALVAAWPDRVRRVDLGTSTEGRPLVALRIGDADAAGAALRLVGGHHGDEWASVEVALEAAERLAAVEVEDPELATALADRPVWVLPLANPDGHAARSRYSATAVDLNRNYDYAWTADEWRPGAHPFSEPETRAVQALHARTGAGAGLSFHSGEINIGWVWNHTTAPTPEAERLEGLADAYAGACDAPGFWQTNGADWYRTWGDTTDWAYGRHGTLDYTVEVSREKTPPASAVPALRATHWAATRAFLLAAAPGPVGVVVDAESGAPVPATLTPVDGAVPRRTGPDGAFHLAGRDAVEVEVASPGLAPRTVRLDPADGPATISLDRSDLLALLPSPRVLSPDGGRLVLRDPANDTVLGPGDLGAVTLARADADPLVLQWSAEDRAWSIPAPADGGSLAPGAWDLETDAGTAPRGVLVEAADGPTTESAWQGDTLVLSGLPDRRSGAAAWVLAGTLRAPVAVAPVDGDDGLRVDLAPWIGTDGPVDLLVHAGGAILPVADVFDAVDDGPDPLDTGAPAGDTGAPDSGTPLADADTGGSPPGEPDGGDHGPSEPAPGGCTAVPSPAHSGLLALPLLLLLPLRRRP